MVKTLLSFAMIGVLGTNLVATAMVLWPWNGRPVAAGGLDFMSTLAAKHVPIPTEVQALRDGYPMAVRVLSGPAGAPLVVMVHGSGWHGRQFEGLGRKLAQVADVVIPDLRGHGVAPARRGDVDYIGQMEDDLADLIAARAKPGQRVILLGHSSGGGLVVRFARRAQHDLISGAVLLAPFLQYDAPTTQKNSGGWAQTSLRRMIGLSILNAFRITALNGTPVIRFAMPRAVMEGPLGATATVEYSFRLNTSFGPRRDWKKDVAALPRFLLVAGDKDEAFHASAYQPVMSAITDKGSYLTVAGPTHLEIVDAPETAAAAIAYLRGVH